MPKIRSDREWREFDKTYEALLRVVRAAEYLDQAKSYAETRNRMVELRKALEALPERLR